MVRGKDTGKVFPLDAGDYVIGRGSFADIALDAESVSRKHARVYLAVDGRWHVADLGSSGGTFVNESRHRDVSDAILHVEMVE